MLRLALLTISLATLPAVQAVAAPAGDINVDIVRGASTSAIVGQRLTLRLNNRVASGKLWYMLNSPEPEMSYVGQRFERPQVNLPDVRQDQIFEFNPKIASVKTLRFAYGVGPGRKVERVLNVRVTISGAN